MSRVCENLETLVDFLRGFKHESDLPLPQPNSTVESVMNFSSSSSPTSEQKTKKRKTKEIEEENKRKNDEAAAAAKAEDEEEEEEDENEKFDAAAILGETSRSAAKKETSSVSTNSKINIAVAVNDNDDDTNQQESQNDGENEEGENTNQDLFNESSSSDDDDDDESINNNKRKTTTIDVAKHLRKIDLVIVRMTPKWAAGVSGFLMTQWQEREIYLLNKKFGEEAVKQAMIRQQQEREERRKEMEKERLQREQEEQRRREQSGGGGAGGVGDSSYHHHQQQISTTGRSSSNKNNKNKHDRDSAPLGDSPIQQQAGTARERLARKASSFALARRHSQHDPNIIRSATPSSPLPRVASDATLLVKSIEEVDGDVIVGSDNNNKEEAEQVEYIDNHLRINLEICTIDPATIMKQLSTLQQQHRKRLDALRQRDRIVRDALDHIIARKQHEDTVSQMAAERKRARRLQQQGGNSSNVTQNNTNNSSPSSTGTVNDSTIASLELAAASVFHNKDDWRQEDHQSKWREIKIPSKPFVPSSLIAYLHPLIRPWQDVAHPTYLVFRRKTEEQQQVNNNNTNNNNHTMTMNNFNAYNDTTNANQGTMVFGSTTTKTATFPSQFSSSSSSFSLLGTCEPRDLQIIHSYIMSPKHLKEHLSQIHQSEIEFQEVTALMKRYASCNNKSINNNINNNDHNKENNQEEETNVKSTPAFTTSSPFLNFEFIEGVEGVDVPVIEDCLTRVCEQRKNDITNFIVKSRVTVAQEIFADEKRKQQHPAGSTFSSFGMKTNNNNNTSPARREESIAGTSGGLNEVLQQFSEMTRATTAVEDKVSASSAATKSPGVRSIDAGGNQQQHHNENSNSNRTPGKENIKNQETFTTEHDEDEDEDDEDSDEDNYDLLGNEYDDIDNFDLDQLEAEATEKTLQSAIEVLEIAQRHADNEKRNNNINNMNNNNLSQSASAASYGSASASSPTTRTKKLFKGTSMKYPGSKTKIENNNSPPTSSRKNSPESQAGEGDEDGDKNNNNDENDDQSRRLSLQSSANNNNNDNNNTTLIPRPPAQGSDATRKNSKVGRTRLFSIVSASALNNNDDDDNDLHKFADEERERRKKLQQTKQKTLAKLPDDILLKKQRMMSLGDYMKEVKSGVFDVAARKNRELKKRRKDAREASFRAIKLKKLQRELHQLKESGEDLQGNTNFDDIQHQSSELLSGVYNSGDAFDNFNDGASSSSSSSSTSSEEVDEDDINDEDQKLLDLLDSQENAEMMSVKDLVKNLFGQRAAEQDKQNELQQQTFSDGPLDVMSAEERAKAEAAAAQRLLGAEQLKKQQEEHRECVRSLIGYFPRTRKARSAAAFVIQCAWRRLCQFRRMGVVIDGDFYTHAQARQMKKLERLKKLQARREALIKEKITEIIQRIYRAQQAHKILRKLQKQAGSSLKIANEFAKRKAKRSSVYCTSNTCWGVLGIPLPAPFDRKVLILGQLELMRRCWLTVCKQKEQEMLEEMMREDEASYDPKDYYGTMKGGRFHRHGSMGAMSRSCHGSIGKLGNSLNTVYQNLVSIVGQGVTGEFHAPARDDGSGDGGASAGPAAVMTLNHVLEKPSIALPHDRLQLLTVTNNPAASVVARNHTHKVLSRSVADIEAVMQMMNASVAESEDSQHFEASQNPGFISFAGPMMTATDMENSVRNPGLVTFAEDVQDHDHRHQSFRNSNKPTFVIDPMNASSSTSATAVSGGAASSVSFARANSSTFFNRSATSSPIVLHQKSFRHKPEDIIPVQPPSYPGSKISAFGLVASCLQIKAQMEERERLKEIRAYEKTMRRKSVFPGAAFDNLAAASAASGGGVFFGGGENPFNNNNLDASVTASMQQQQSHFSPASNHTNSPSRRALPPPVKIDRERLSYVEMLGTVEVLLPRTAFAPESTWLEVRAILLSKMNEEEFRIVTQKCLNPR